MSHLLQTSSYMEGKSVLSIPCKQIIAPKYRKLLGDSHALNHEAKLQLNKQQAILKNLCQKLTEKQLDKLQIENEINLRKKFQKLKQKMRQNVIAEGKQSQVIQHFQGKNHQESLSSLIQLNIHNIELGTKYHHRIANKLICIKQISHIEDNKEKYRVWLNTTNNSPLKSPNYSKMSYIMQKISRKRQLNEIFQCLNPNQTIKSLNSVSSHQFKDESLMIEKQNIKKFQNSPNSDSANSPPSFLTKIQHSEYLSKSKVKNFRVKRL